jgi:thiol:disulfide interchange protein
MWIFGRSNVLSASIKKKVFGFIILILSVLYFYYSVGSFNKLIEKHLPTYNGHIEWQEWSIHEVEKGLSQGRPVFVNFTADWCITCKVNEGLTFSSEAASQFVEEKGILMLKADWTMKDDTIGKELQKHGRFGVPLYLMYTPENPTQPKMLKQIITLTDFKESLK